MITKSTVIDQIEVTGSGYIQVRLGLVLSDNGVEISRRYHRTAIEPNGNVEAQMAAVDAHLQSMNEQPSAPADVVKIRAIANAAWATP